MKSYYKEQSYIHYSNCHEDAEFALSHIKNNPKRILTLASALDNALSLLLLEPDYVLAVDFNDTQIYLSKLKKCAIEHLEYEDFLILLGVKNGDRQGVYNNIKAFLDEETKKYFDEHDFLIFEIGLVNCGKLEYYFQFFKKYVLPFTHSKKTLNQFLTAETLEEQQRIYKKKFDNLRFKLLFSVFFSKSVMKLLGRDKDYFKYAKGSLASGLKRKLNICAECNLNKDNPYLQYILQGEMKAMPLYLKPESYYKIKASIHKLEIKKASFKDEIKFGNSYDFIYLSDIFEYMSQEETDEISKDIALSLNPKGSALLYNMMIERHVKGLRETQLCQNKNRTFYYMNCYLYEKD